MSLKNKLNRLKDHIIKEEKSQPVMEERKTAAGKTALKAIQHGDEYCLLRETSYPLDYQHGIYNLGECMEVISRWNSSGLQHPLTAKGHNPGDLFFFDTETTGLGGGAGNMIFLLGHASFTDKEVVVRQHLLPKPGHEVAFYKDFLKYVDITTLVTYNGKSFDWPQVKTRHTLIREFLPELPSFGHFDLYHASRRLWKHKGFAMKLANVESEILGINREDDVPGYLAPIIYQHYVQTGDESVLEGILKHNELDVLTLITLYTHLSRKLLGVGMQSEGDDKEEYEVARWYELAGEHGTAFQEYERIAKEGTGRLLDAKHKLAAAFKKKKEWDEAVPLWEEIAAKDRGKLRLDAYVQLAMYYEHTVKDLDKALEYTGYLLQAAKECKQMGGHGSMESVLTEGNKRKNRLTGKLSVNYSPGKRRK
ncbi:hypothetical protein GKZ89_01785 [Bacillus mangrovi]|uniref:YprB ribonuclease H-like domain-containing protein n=1 Tax=Metabacillus mangrovi TaxID=1491830 RepID=A0A7X2S1P1_9BACI|nr:ribonuclease H-like domain-containing protein [Metabacillus mangrovi]MTH52119.1 hypothetical protein [Metabacillus mangrovi]